MPRCADVRETAEVISKVSRRRRGSSPWNLTEALNLEQVGFKSFLNITPTISFPQNNTQSTPSSAGAKGPTEFILTFDENPLAEFAELPKDAMGTKGKPQAGPIRTKWATGEVGGQEEGLWFSNIYCGVIRGCLEMVSYVSCHHFGPGLQNVDAYVTDRCGIQIAITDTNASRNDLPVGCSAR